jgi:hypothetical protein
VDLKNAQAVVLPAKGKSFDPTKIPRAVKDAGFTPGEIKVTVVGTLVSKAGMLLLQMPGVFAEFVLAGGVRADELKKRHDLLQKKLRVTGNLHPSHADRPPGLTVERWLPTGGS